jgi:chemotaxis protein methyltransferase CheR
MTTLPRNDPAAATDDASDADFELELTLLLEAVYAKYRHDFRGYARPTLRRRARLAMERLGCGTLSELQGRMLRDPAVFAELFALLTVQVSAMFRDPTFFRALREHVVPFLATYSSFKVWVAGCGEGEELYSLAILLREEGLLDRALFYATDIHPGALATAERGVYPIERFAAWSASYLAAGGRGSLSDHYVVGEHHAALDRTLRRNVLFADHSLATDGVFAEVHLVTCRNVLIYFDRPLQARALSLFAEALVPGGFLGLGPRETLRFAREAEALVAHWGPERIYRRKRSESEAGWTS